MLASDGIFERVTSTPRTCDLEALRQARLRVNARLERLAPRPGLLGHRVADAIRYSLLGGGKRLRPVLTVITARVLGSDGEQALDPACAVEMLHTASLILDDLPCMDDAALRRGKPATHRVYGEDMASLAVVTLISEAFAVLSRSHGLSGELRAGLVGVLAEAIGLNGLAGGQASDLSGGEFDHDRESLACMDEHKTGTLFVSSVQIGARIAGAEPAETEALTRYARHAGLAFQIFDDLLDTCADGSDKDVGQDTGKVTFGTLMDRHAAEALAMDRCRAALATISHLRHPTGLLAAFLQVMVDSYRCQVRLPT